MLCQITIVFDLATTLEERYDQRVTVDVSDIWSEDDLDNLVRASLAYAERTIWVGEERQMAERSPGTLENASPLPINASSSISHDTLEVDA
jgi:hypothetical protein